MTRNMFIEMAMRISCR